jgi:hypothetical protein
MTQTRQVNLIDFLLSRIAEDEAAAMRQQAFDAEWRNGAAFALTPLEEVGIDGARVLAECEAKRRIVHAHQPFVAEDGDEGYCESEDGRYRMRDCPTLTSLAFAYADHPDYRSEWAV